VPSRASGANQAPALPDYVPVPRSSQGPAVNDQGFYGGRVERNLYWVTDGDCDQQAVDRLAIRELFDAYAHCADRRDAEGQKALFTVDRRFAVYMDGEGTEATYVLEGRESLTPVFADLNRYETTAHSSYSGSEQVASLTAAEGGLRSGPGSLSCRPVRCTRRLLGSTLEGGMRAIGSLEVGSVTMLSYRGC
jgi:hypothetical protein